MRKEVIFAIVAGALLGLVVAFGVWRANVALRSTTNNTKPQETPTPVENIELSIIKPDNLIVTTKPIIAVSGITTANSTVTISGELKDYVLAADSSGAFSQDVALDGGLNEIKVFSFDKDGAGKQKDILVVYSSEFSKYLAPAPTASDSAEVATDSVRQKVNEKIEAIEKSPVSYIGTITDKTDTNIQIKDPNGEIQQIAIDKETTSFVKSIDTPKTIESTDLAIGDFIIAMGFRDGNKILDGKRILVTSPFKSDPRTAKLGMTTKDKLNVVTLKDKDNTFTLKFGTSWIGPEISELTETDKYVVAGELKDFNLTVSLIKKI